jgi:hypothetical protein
MSMESSSSEAAGSSSSEAAVLSSASEVSSSSAEASTAPSTTVGKLPATGLSGDTQIAANGSTAKGYGYVGVWATDAAACANIDQPGATGFAVITVATFRDGPSAIYGNFKGLDADGKVTLNAGGTSGSRSIALQLTDPNALTIDGKAYVRCSP